MQLSCHGGWDARTRAPSSHGAGIVPVIRVDGAGGVGEDEAAYVGFGEEYGSFAESSPAACMKRRVSTSTRDSADAVPGRSVIGTRRADPAACSRESPVRGATGRSTLIWLQARIELAYGRFFMMPTSMERVRNLVCEA